MRDNAARLVLGAVGVAVLVIGLAQDRQALAATLAVLGIVVVVVAVLLPRVKWLKMGPSGLELELLEQLKTVKEEVKTVERKVDAIVAVAAVQARAEVPTPTVKTTSDEQSP